MICTFDAYIIYALSSIHLYNVSYVTKLYDEIYYRFAIAMTYYGISMNVAKFSGDVFVNFAASSSAEFFGIIFCWLITDRVGRKGLFCTAMILGGVTCICTIFTSLYADKCKLTCSLYLCAKRKTKTHVPHDQFCELS